MIDQVFTFRERDGILHETEESLRRRIRAEFLFPEDLDIHLVDTSTAELGELHGWAYTVFSEATIRVMGKGYRWSGGMLVRVLSLDEEWWDVPMEDLEEEE